jgi:hypothetical protein
MKTIGWTIIAAASIGAVTALAASVSSTVAYPEGYRSWRHVKSMIIEPGHALAGLVEGTHHIYANERAMAGYGRRPFPDGAVIVFDLLETKVGDKAIEEGARKAVIVMRKDRKRFAATGGWGYEVFAGGDAQQPQVGAKASEMCHTCHVSQRARDYVFSDYRP